MRELYCPKCEEPTEMLLSLGNREVTCNCCSHTSTIADVEAMVAKMRAALAGWEKVIAWVKTMPM